MTTTILITIITVIITKVLFTFAAAAFVNYKNKKDNVAWGEQLIEDENSLNKVKQYYVDNNLDNQEILSVNLDDVTDSIFSKYFNRIIDKEKDYCNIYELKETLYYNINDIIEAVPNPTNSKVLDYILESFEEDVDAIKEQHCWWTNQYSDLTTKLRRSGFYYIIDITVKLYNK